MLLTQKLTQRLTLSLFSQKLNLMLLIQKLAQRLTLLLLSWTLALLLLETNGTNQNLTVKNTDQNLKRRRERINGNGITTRKKSDGKTNRTLLVS